MSENRYTIEGLVGEFRLVPRHSDTDTPCRHCSAYRGFRLGCIAVKRDDIDCHGKILELIPGTDAPAVDPRDAEISELRAKLSALESAKPLAVLPPLTDGDLDTAYELHGCRYMRVSVEHGYNLAHSCIQPVAPEYLAAMEEYYNAPNWPAQDTCRKKVEAVRARLAAGKGGK